MKPLQNDPRANITELLKTADVDLLFTEMFSVLNREKLELFGKTVRLSEGYVATVIVEPTNHYFGEQGTYRLLSSSPDIEFKVIEKKQGK
jgi:hypothetical protein